MADKDDKILGLGTQPKSEWILFTEADAEKSPIELLEPGSDRHKRVLAYILNRVNLSESYMKDFKSRWRVSERKYQAYIDLPDWEQLLKDMNDDGKPAVAVNITVPYTFATIMTIVTYMFHTLTGRTPLFQVAASKSESVQPAQKMELALQYQADHTRLIKQLYVFLLSTQIYGVGALKCWWEQTTALRTKITTAPKLSPMGMTGETEQKRERVESVVYEGNCVEAIDPFLFLPDPRVPMTDVNAKGEFAFWIIYEGKHALKIAESKGELKWVNSIPKKSPYRKEGVDSNRSLAFGGDSNPGQTTAYSSKIAGQGEDFIEKITGTIEIIPAELGLGESDVPEKWLFSIGNRGQILQAEPFDADHNKHPVAVAEPYTTGFGFGNAGIADYLNPLQDVLSWLVNSHMDNVKLALNNMWVVDPSKVEIQDLKEPGAGKLIRLKRSAYGQNVNEAIRQLPVADVTGGNIQDFQMFSRIGDGLAAISDNLRGQQDSGGRKTATEARMSGEAGGSRLSAQVRLISAQAITDLTEMMSLNTQQYVSEEFMAQIAGSADGDSSIAISPEHLVGDFHYPVHDGTMPLDRVALLDVWQQVMQAVLSDPRLSQSYDVGKIFEFVADLGGAKNIKSFRVKIAPEGAEMPQGAVPVQDAAKQLSGNVAGLESNPSDRVTQGTPNVAS